MKWWIAALSLFGAMGCVAPGAGLKAAAPGVGGEPVLAPGSSPPPSSPDATMPASLPPPQGVASLEQRSSAYRTGSSLVPIGGGLAAGGIAFVILGAVLPCQPSDAKCTPTKFKDDHDLGTVFFALGGTAIGIGVVCLAIGIPLMIVGADEIKRQMGVAVYVGPGGAGLRF